MKNLTVKTENFILKVIITSAERKVISVWKYAFLFLFVAHFNQKDTSGIVTVELKGAH